MKMAMSFGTALIVKGGLFPLITGPVTPVAPVVPVAPVAPVSPVTPVAPAAPVAPVTPVGPVGPRRLRPEPSQFRSKSSSQHLLQHLPLRENLLSSLQQLDMNFTSLFFIMQ